MFVNCVLPCGQNRPKTLLLLYLLQDLLVHCEQQVLRFVLRYLEGTRVEPAELFELCSEVRFLYLDNKLLGSLSGSLPPLPTQLLLSGAMAR